MKKIALTLVIAASLSAGTVLAAEPFKDRGIDYRTTTQLDSSVQREAVTAQTDRFKNGGIDHLDAVSVKANIPRAEVNPVISRFNDRSHMAFTTERQGVVMEDEAQFSYSR